MFTQKKYLFALLFFFSFLSFVAHTAYTKTAIFADSRFYFSYTRSIVKDFDLNFFNEYEYFDVSTVIGNTNTPVNYYPPGVALFWTPLYFVFNAPVSFIEWILGIDTDGYGFLYQMGPAVTTIFLGISGFYLILKMLREYFSKETSLLTALALFGTTNLLFYIAVEPINSHGVSFFVSTLFAFCFLYMMKTTQHKAKPYLFLGFIAGVMGTIRTQDLGILIIPCLHTLTQSQKTKKIFALATGVLFGFLPQILLWEYFFNTFYRSPYLNYGFDFLHPHIFHVLFNTQNGLFTLTPIIAIALGGLFLFWRRNKQLALYALMYFILQLFLISSWHDYHQGGSFSIRMIISTYPFLVFGLAEMVKRLKDKYGDQKTLALIILFVLLNSFLIIRYLILF